MVRIDGIVQQKKHFAESAMSESFGAMLRRHRRLTGLTQAALAEIAGISEQAISTLERESRRHPRVDTVTRLADALSLSDEDRSEFAAAARRKHARHTGNTAKPSGTTATQVDITPRQLPPTVDDFTGRRVELNSLVAVLAMRRDNMAVATRVATVTGMSGIGKSALAIRAGHMVADRFPDGQVYIDLHGFGPSEPLSALQALGQLLRSLGVRDDAIPSNAEEAAGLYRSRLAHRRVLLILDNAADARHVAPLVPGTADSAAIVTSRRELSALPGSHHIHLDTLSEDDALALLVGIVGRARVEAELSSAIEVVEQADRIPLAIRLVGARLAARPNWTVAHLSSQLSDEHQRLDALGLDDSGARASFAGSLDHLSSSDDPWDHRAAGAFSLLGLSNGTDLSLPVAARLLDASESEAETIAERLVDLNLLSSPSPRRYRFHDLLHSYAKERAAESLSGAQQNAALMRVLRLYADLGWEGQLHSHPWSPRLRLVDAPPTQASRPIEVSAQYEWFDHERANIRAATSQAASNPTEFSAVVIELSLALFGYHVFRGDWLDMRYLNAMAIDLASDLPVSMQSAWLEHDRAIPDIEQGHFSLGASRLESSLRAFVMLDDVAGEARCCSALCHALERLDKLEEAILWGERGLQLSLRSNDRAAEGTSRLALGVLFLRNDDAARAEEYFQRSLQLAEQAKLHRAIGRRRVVMGRAYRKAGRFGDATAHLEAAEQVAIDIADPTILSECLFELGNCVVLSEPDIAIARFNQALELSQKYGERHREAETLRSLGVVSLDLGRRGDALEYWRAALEIFEQQGIAAADEVRALIAEHG